MNHSPISISFLFVYFLITCRTAGATSTQLTGDFSINCGSNAASAALNGRQWLGDVHLKLSPLLQINGKSTTSTLTTNLASDDPVPHKTARISRSSFSYSFHVDSGQKIIRLHFNPSPYKGFRAFKDLFTVKSGGFILLGNFSASLTADSLGVNTFAKEFCLNIQPNHQLNLTFSPETSQSLDAYAFINGIEIISVPASLSYFHGSGIELQPGEKSLERVDGSTALEIIQRQNLKQDAGNWDSSSMFPKWATQEVIKKRNSSWKIPVEVGFRYLIRLHFSEMGLEIAETGKLRFEVHINEMIAQTNSDISRARDGKHVVLFRDCIVMMAGLKTDEKRDILISFLSYDELRDGRGILEGYEIVKLSNPDNSLASSNPLLRREVAPSGGFLYLLISLLGNRNAIATVVITIICLINVIVYKLRCNREASSGEEENRPSERAERLFRHFSLAEIQLATRNFNEGLVIGKGGFGKVYKGLIDEGKETVAVKRLKSCSKQGAREFLTEIETLSELRHINLVALIGYCKERREMILVYEYMPNGTLADHLYKNARRNRDHSPLTWKQRLNICIEAGRGLDYLHTGLRIIHRDVKPSNILLDGNFVAKVSDFGLAKPEDKSRLHSHVSTRVKGTFGYIDPYYVRTQKLTKESDTYAFGVVLLEVLCGRPAVEPWFLEDERILDKWAVDKITKGEVDQIVASYLRKEISPSSLKTYVGVVGRCLHDEPKNRPTMAQVVQQLDLALELQESKIPLVLDVIENAPAKIEQTENTGLQPTMTTDDLQNVTHSPKGKENNELVNPEPTSGREARRKSTKHKQSRFWLRGAFWNRANTSKETESYRSDWKRVAAATNHFSSINMVGQGARVYKAALSTGKGLQELKNEVLFLGSTHIYVNEKHLSMEELLLLQSCPNPPKKLRPGRYWYDRFSGYWGKEGEKPCQLMTPELAVGGRLRQDASNGNTNIFINNREITKAELLMLQAAGINCQGDTHLWVTEDGSCQHEGMATIIGKLWDRKLVRMLCSVLALPFPSDTVNHVGEEVNKDRDKLNAKNLEESMTYKLLLVGCDQSGTSTIFKQVKTLYSALISEDEKQNIKIMIQRYLYTCICILLEGRQCIKKYYVTETRRQSKETASTGYLLVSGDSDWDDEIRNFSLPPNLEDFSNWLVQIMISGSLEVIIPALLRELSPLTEQLWQNKAFQTIYRWRNKLPALPRDATYFLDRAVEISRVDYEPSEMDILYSEGIASNEVASMEFSLAEPSPYQDDQLVSCHCQLIRVHAGRLGGNCKLLDMFKDVNLVLCCVSLTDYAEYYEDVDGLRTNKMLETKKVFEKIVTHPTLAGKDFLVVLNKFDLLEEMIKRVPLSECSWFRDFNPYNGNNTPFLAELAFHYMGLKFKKTFRSLTERKLYVKPATALDARTVDEALKYGKEIFKWDVGNFSMDESSTYSFSSTD